MATQASLFLRNGASVTELPASFMADAPSDNGDNGRPPARAIVQDPGVDLAKKTVCIKMRLSTMGNTRKVSTSQIEADADKDLLRVSKHLLDSAELKAIGRFDGEIRRFLYNICLPFEIGIHLLPIAALEIVEDRMRKFAEDRQVLVAAFLSVYPSLCQDAAKASARFVQSRRLPSRRRSHPRVRAVLAIREFRRAGPTQGHLPGSVGAGA